MKKVSYLLITILTTLGLLFSGSAFAKKPYLTSVNNTCSTSNGCGLCHVDSGGGGPLNPDGEAFAASGYDPTIFCPGSGCTDNDGDGYFVEGGSCGSVDCDDKNAAINPGEAEICDNTTDDDCDGQMDCADGECTNAPVCQTGVDPEICDDGIDNDGDNKVDCADKKDCNGDPACSGGGGDPEVCDDGLDKYGDGITDCDDRDCRRDSACTGGGGSPEICDDGIDNDLDGKTDCADKKDCGKDPAC